MYKGFFRTCSCTMFPEEFFIINLIIEKNAITKVSNDESQLLRAFILKGKAEKQ